MRHERAFDAEVRLIDAALDRLQAKPLKAVEIDDLEGRGELEEVEEISDLADEVAVKVVERRAKTKPASGPPPPSTTDAWARWAYAKSLATANYATWGPDDRAPVQEALKPAAWVTARRRFSDQREVAFMVQEFRSAHLGGGLLSVEEVEQWVLTQAEADGPAREVGRFVMDESGSPVGEPLSDPEQLELAYRYRAGSRWRRGTVAVNPGGVLDELRLLSKELARRLRWQPEDAATFVVAKVVPQVDVLSSRLEPTANGTTVVLHADADLDVDLVAGEFMAARARPEVTQPQGPRKRLRWQRLSEKSIDLVIFTLGHPEANGRGLWELAMKSDDDEIKARAAAGRKAFRRSVNNATHRVLYGTSANRG